VSSGPPSERDSPFPAPELDSVRGRGEAGGPLPPPQGRRRPLAIVAVVALVAVGAVSAAVALWDGDGSENPGPPVTTQPTTTEGEEEQPPR
jgi:hypothetical protein